jgi:hypothetical protein
MLSTQAQVNPGSEIAGVPASDINAIFSAFNREIKFDGFMLVMHVMTVHVCTYLIMLKAFRWCGCLRQELSRPLLES